MGSGEPPRGGLQQRKETFKVTSRGLHEKKMHNLTPYHRLKYQLFSYCEEEVKNLMFSHILTPSLGPSQPTLSNFSIF